MLKSLYGHLLFELNYHFRRPSFWLIALVFAFFGFVDLVSNATQGNAYFFVNSPSQVFQTTVWYSLFAVLAVTAFVAEAIVRDARTGIESLILVTPVKKFNYLGVRYLAAFLMAMLAFSCYLPGMIAGSFMPGLNPYAIGPFRFDAYVASFTLITLPNLIWVSVYAFVLASWSRSMVVTFIGAIVLVMLYVSAMLMVGVEQMDYDLLQLWTYADPYGYFALEAATQSWTVHQHNHQMPDVFQGFATNRMIWMLVAVLGWWLAYSLFDMRPNQARSRRKQRDTTLSDSSGTDKGNLTDGIESFLGRTTRNTAGFGSLPVIIWYELGCILRSRPFQILMFCGLVSLLFAASGSSSFEYSNPSTDILIHTAGLYFDYVLFAIVVFYAAELMWRDRDCGVQGVIDAMPIGNGLLVGGKLLALFAVITLNLLLCMLVLLLYQVAHGYYQFELGLSALMLFGVNGPYFYFVAVLAFFFQALTRHKYGGMLLTLLVSLSPIPLDAFGLYHNLYQFGDTNDLGYSPMNGYGFLLEGHWWYSAYWASVCALLVLLTIALWPRGENPRSYSLCSSGMPLRWSMAGGTAVIAGLACWIVYNTTVVNPYQPPGKDLLAVGHEKQFKQYENLPMPVVTATEVKVDLYPEPGFFLAKGKYTLENRSGEPVEELHLSTFINLELVQAKYPGATLDKAFPELGYYIYRLDTPLQPGAAAELEFVTRTGAPAGFRNQSNADDVYMIAPNDVVQNGSSLYSPFILPFIGYTKMVEHKEAWLRQKHGLPPLDSRMRPHDDPVGLARALTVSHLTWGETDLVASTSYDQKVVSSGKELKRWQDEGRNFVHYQGEEFNRGKFTLYSGRFATAVNQEARVPVKAWYHPPHESNVQPMLGHLAGALTVYEKAFGPYPFSEVRLAEFAYYPGMVFSEAGTIGLPEVLGWKAELNGEGEDAMVGWLSYLLAHSWWEDQIITADVAGGMSVREALSGYASNLYRRSVYEPERFHRIKQKQVRDYFRALGQVDFAEPPLDDVYNEVLPARFKGQMVLEQIESAIGQDALLAGIRAYLADYRGKSEPYATLPGLVASIMDRSPPNLRGRISELFSKVVTYRLGVLEADVASASNGQYRVAMRLEARKLYTRALGEQDDNVVDWPVTLRIESQDGRVLYEEPWIAREQIDLVELELDDKPYKVTLDPDLNLPGPLSANREKTFRAI